MKNLQIVPLVLLLMLSTFSCASPSQRPISSEAAKDTGIVPAQPSGSPSAHNAMPQLSPAPGLTGYAFPTSVDPTRRYLIYLHGKIIEDQGLPAVSPDYGEYEYEAILETFSAHGFVVISEQRPKDADWLAYATRATVQVAMLLNKGVPAENITVVGASKGAGIAIYVSHYLENLAVNYVIMAICHPDEVETLIQNRIYLNGNVLSIYDSVDEYAGSCQELFAFSDGKGIERHDEIVLQVGTGHGILYKPLDEWVLPVVQWAGNDTP